MTFNLKLYLIVTLLVFSQNSCDLHKTKKEIVKISVSYINLNTSFFEPRSRDDFDEVEDLKKIFYNKQSDIEEFSENFDKLNYSLSKFQFEIDPRVSIKFDYEDSTNKTYYLDATGDIMIDTISKVYTRNKTLLRFLEEKINDTELKWTDPE